MRQAFQNLSVFKKDLTPMSARPVGWVYDRVQARRNDGGLRMGKRAIAVRGTKFDPPGGSVSNFVQSTPKEEFSAVILELRLKHDLSRKAIGKIAGVGSETVKAWERGRQMGQFEHIARLSQSIKSVRQFALRQLGATHEDLDFISPQVLTAMVAALHQVAQQPGPDGDAVRAALSSPNAYRGMNKP